MKKKHCRLQKSLNCRALESRRLFAVINKIPSSVLVLFPRYPQLAITRGSTLSQTDLLPLVQLFFHSVYRIHVQVKAQSAAKQLNKRNPSN